MKNLYLIILILILIFCSGFDVTISYQPEVDKLENLFKAVIPLRCGIMYTKVPRGLIISIDEKCFFNKGEVRIKESSLDILDAISYMLVKLPNYCVIENHTEEHDFNENWELSVSRASNLAEYMIKYRKLPIEKVFSLGFGETMPFKDNVAPKNGLNNRIDFVIIEYEAKR